MKRSRTAIIRFWVLVVIGVAVNLLGLQVNSAMGAKLFLDTLGTVATAALGGTAPGIVVGLIASVIASWSDPTQLYYVSINILIAVIAANATRRGAFTCPARTLAFALMLALVCSIVEAVLTWAISGMTLGSGVPGEYAQTFVQSMGWSPLFAQMAGSALVEFPDKLITCAIAFLALRWMPKRITDCYPFGGIYLYRNQLADSHGRIRQAFMLHRSLSLEAKTMLITATTAILLGCACLAVSYHIYENMTTAHYEQLGSNVCSLAATHIDADAIDTYLDQGASAEGYQTTQQSLSHLDQIMDAVTDIYVYRISQDGCHVVFDTDQNPATRSTVGDVVGFDESFQSSIPTLLQGGRIDPVISNGKYGWLLTVYQPLFKSDGTCTAYVCIDISMGDLLADRVAFIAKVAAIVFAITILIIVFSSARVRRSVVNPINQLSLAARSIAFDQPDEREHDIEQLHSINIKTGDEIETLYSAVSKMTDDAVGYIEEIGESNRKIAHQVQVIRRMQQNTIISFAELTDARDKLTGGHIRRTSKYMDMLANAALEQGVYPEELSPDFVRECIRSAPLHDIGKIEISDTLLNKPGKFTDAEYQEMKTHAPKGGRILKSVLAGIEEEDSGYLDTAVDMATYHHERWDGTGYPDGLAGTDIPLCARLMAIVDVFDALYAKRPYKEGLSFDECMDIMRNERGKAFDPTLFAVFESIKENVHKAAADLAKHPGKANPLLDNPASTGSKDSDG